MQKFSNTVEELFDLQKFAMKLGLDNIRYLCRYLNNPHLNYPVIHIAGTNGKGSTAFFLAAILQEMGLKTALFTSPHLSDFRERIRVNGEKISKTYVAEFWREVKKIVLAKKATFFDTTTAMALQYFNVKRVDVAVVETGLGGRLDSTNIVQPETVILTPIHFDHQKQLGNSLKQIAEEKAGIIKNNAIVFCAAQKAEALDVIKNKINQTNRFFYMEDHIETTIHSAELTGSVFSINDIIHRTVFEKLAARQLGSFQPHNISLAYLVSRIFLRERHYAFNKSKFRDLLKKAHWSGRLELKQTSPNILFDVSHNPQGIITTIENVKAFKAVKDLHILIGLTEDKDYKKMAPVIAQYSTDIMLTEPLTHRKLAVDILYKEILNFTQNAEMVKDLYVAYEKVLNKMRPSSTLLVIGSHYLTGPLLDKFNKTEK
jgi:dihydrofolate synthase/folylpolyglutamate synthase